MRKLMLFAVLCAIVAFSGSLQARVLFYEGFDASAGTALADLATPLGGSGSWLDTSSGVGEGGGTGSPMTVRANGTSVGQAWTGIPAGFPQNGGFLEGEFRDENEGHILLDSSVTATFVDGAVTWMSYVSAPTERIDTGDTNHHKPNLAIGQGALLDNRAQEADGQAIGAGTRFNNYGNTRAVYWNPIAGTDNDLNYSDDSAGAFLPQQLIIAKIEWGATSDTVTAAVFDISAYTGLTEADFDAAVQSSIASSIDLDQATFDTLSFHGTRANFDEFRIATTFEEAVGLSDPMEPFPEDGSTVMAGSVELSWTNLPNDSSDVYVDVWFWTEPNELHPGYDMTRIVETGENTDAKIVDASAPDTYYWQVNSYLNGAGHINDANMIEGNPWSFITAADLVPTVEIVTGDTMTWPGEGVPLDSTVTDDAESAVTIEWIADLPAGVSVAYSLGNDVADTTVTFTTFLYGTEASIINAGFEDPVLADGGFADAEGWGWSGGAYRLVTNPYAPGGDTVGGGLYPAFGGIAPGGNNIAQTGLGGIAQVLTETLAADTTYTLTVEAGNAAFETGRIWKSYKVQLLAGGTPSQGEITEGTLLAEDANSIDIVPDTFETITVVFDSTGVDPDLLGQPLQIRLLSGTATAEPIYFDEVRLTADPGFIPTGLQTVTMTVSVSDEGNPAPGIGGTASINIEIYDDACHLAQVGEGKSAVTDFSGDCITALEDLAAIAASWLDDYSTTGPIAK